MTPYDFSMWGFGVIVWLFTAFSAVWGYHLLRHLIREFAVSRVMQEIFVQDLIEGNYEMTVEDEDDTDDEPY